MNSDIDNILLTSGEDFEINPYWKYHGSINLNNMVSIFEHGILNKATLIRTNYNKFNTFDYPSQNGQYRVSLALGPYDFKYESLYGYLHRHDAYQMYIDSKPAAIVSDDVLTQHYHVKVVPLKGIMSLF